MAAACSGRMTRFETGDPNGAVVPVQTVVQRSSTDARRISFRDTRRPLFPVRCAGAQPRLLAGRVACVRRRAAARFRRTAAAAVAVCVCKVVQRERERDVMCRRSRCRSNGTRPRSCGRAGSCWRSRTR